MAKEQIYISDDILKQAESVFLELGLTVADAVNIFLRQCIFQRGLPFSVKLPQYSDEVLDAMKEAREISSDPNTKAYSSMADLKKALEDDL